MKVLHGMKTWNICMIRTIYFSLADLWKEKCKKWDGEIIQRCEVVTWQHIGAGAPDLLVAAVVVLDNRGRPRLLVEVRLGLRLAGPGAGGPVPGPGRDLLAALVGPVGLLDDLSRLVKLPLLLVRQGQVWEILLTFCWSLKSELEIIFLFIKLTLQLIWPLSQVLCLWFLMKINVFSLKYKIPGETRTVLLLWAGTVCQS